jgi:putative Mg2+ transporter-C (MgtC) family protein
MHWITAVAQGTADVYATSGESIFRLGLAAALGGLIGLEREASGKPAGFRTNLLICLGAALVTELSIGVARDVTLPGGFRSDPGRLAAQIVSGIGFLGAGTIIRSRGSVVGLTTAATLWVVAAIGMAVGAGAYIQAIVGTGLVILALVILGRFEDYLLPFHYHEHVLRVTFAPGRERIADVEKQLAELGYHARIVEIERIEQSLVVAISARGRRHGVETLLRRLMQLDDVSRVVLAG